MREFIPEEFDGKTCLFPLGGVVLFPHAVLPLHIFEPRYRQMMVDSLAGNQTITIIQPKTPVIQTPHGPLLEKVGCLGQIIQHERLDDGRYNLLLAGLKRVRIVHEIDHAGKLYREATVSFIENERVDKIPPKHLVEMSERFLSLLADPKHAGVGDHDLSRIFHESRDPSLMTDMICQALSLPPAMKQILLEENDLPQRVEQLLQILRLLTSHLPEIIQNNTEFPPKFSLN